MVIHFNSLWPSDAIWRYSALDILVNTGSGNGLLPDGTKPLPEPMLIYHVRSRDIRLRAISQLIPKLSTTEITLKITHLKFHSNLSGANELILAFYILYVLKKHTCEFALHIYCTYLHDYIGACCQSKSQKTCTCRTSLHCTSDMYKNRFYILCYSF